MPIDRTSGVPLYVQIKDQIIYEISIASLPAGTVLPSIRQLASQLGVAMATVRHAYASLIEDGFVVAHQGKGMLVAELEQRVTVGEDANHAQVVSLFTAAIGRAAALGASVDEIKTAVARAFRTWRGESRVLFVGSEPEFVEHYAPILAESLKDLDVEVTAVHLKDLVAARPATDVLSLPLCVVTLVRGYTAVRQAFAATPVPIVGLTLNLSDESKTRIMEIPRSARVALVAERMSLQGFKASVEQYLLVDAPLEPVAYEAKDIAAVVGRADVVLHTLRGRQPVKRLALPPSVRTVEIQFVPDPVSFRRMRQAIIAQRQALEASAMALP